MVASESTKETQDASEAVKTTEATEAAGAGRVLLRGNRGLAVGDVDAAGVELEGLDVVGAITEEVDVAGVDLYGALATVCAREATEETTEEVGLACVERGGSGEEGGGEEDVEKSDELHGEGVKE